MRSGRRGAVVAILASVAAGLGATPVAFATTPATGAPPSRVVADEPELDELGIPVWNHELTEIDGRLDALGIYSDFAGTFNGTVIDPETLVLSIRYDSGSPAATIDAFLRRVADLDHRGAITVVAEGVDYDLDELIDLARDVSASGALWAATFGLRDVVGAAPDEAHGGIVVSTSGEAPGYTGYIGDVPVRFLGGVSVVFQ
jgi:hypothetical protein